MIRSRIKDGVMGDSENRNGPQFRAGPLITSASLVGAGTLIVLAGLAVGGGHLVSATRRWVSEMEVPPSEVAKQKWAQTRAAVSAGASAGASAWQSGPRAGLTSDS
jgi:S1-C subfamily serine protease